MGAGQYGCGVGPCGLDPLPAASAPRSVTPPAALRYDGQTKDFLLDANGHYIGIHPVDQKVALALITGLGTIPSSPTTGAAFRQIKRITPSTAATAANMANAALASMVSAKQIQIVSIDVETRSLQGSTLVAVQYINLVTQTKQTITTPSTSFTGT